MYGSPKQYTLPELLLEAIELLDFAELLDNEELLDCEELLIDDDDTELLLDCEELLTFTELLLCPDCDEENSVAEEDVFPEEIPAPLSPELSGIQSSELPGLESLESSTYANPPNASSNSDW